MQYDNLHCVVTALSRCPNEQVSAGLCPYNILGVEPSASRDEIKKAYRTLALKYHPDRNPGGSGARFAEIHEAYAILTNKAVGRAVGGANVYGGEPMGNWEFHDWYW